MNYKLRLSRQSRLFIFLITVSIIAVSGSSVLAAAPVVMDDHFRIKEIENLEIRAAVGAEIRLPKKLEAEFESGIKAEFPVEWKLNKKLSYKEKGIYQIEGKLVIKDYPNPLIEQRADPFIYKHQDGYYYFTASYPEYDRIIMRRAKTIIGLKEAEEKVIWWKHEDKEMSKHIWAPEIHFIDGKWYIYFAAARRDAIWAIRQYVLENDSANPLEGQWTEKGKIEMNFEEFTLDAAPFKHQNQRYFWDQNDNPIFGIPGYEIRGNKDVTLKIIIE